MTGEPVDDVDLVDELLAELTRRAGGYPSPSAAGWAYLAAAAVRGLNHATLGGYTYPAHVDRVVAELQALAERLPQALTQAAGWLPAAHDGGEVVDVADPARTETTVVVDVAGALNRIAAGITAGLAADLAQVHAATSRLACTGPLDDEDDPDGSDVVDQHVVELADEHRHVGGRGDGSGRGWGA